MLENYFIIAYFFMIVAFQSIIGVGVLVLGTPFLLILKFNLVEIFFILLPISIATSLSNLIIIKFSNKSLKKSTYKEFKKFFMICIPSIFVGLILLKIFENFINFKYLVSFVIILSVLLVLLKDKIRYRINFFRISTLSIVGLVHGLTNSGGTLMSLAFTANNDNEYARLNTTFFYLVLAVFQYFLTTIIFFEKFIFLDDVKIFLVLIIGILIGNLVYYYLRSKIYKVIVNSIAIMSAIILLIS
tara:strand:+ start:697 stop:1428 length:732 start_codon:yes stop_codon:yes gene_type:complete